MASKSTGPLGSPSFSLPCNSQSSSALFTVLPGEVRELILEFALSEYEDLQHAYDLKTCYRRPEYMGPRRTDTAVLRTCQAVYREAWFLPWTQARHTFYFASSERRPRKTTQMGQLAGIMRQLQALNVSERRKQVAETQIFAQCYQIEDGQSLQGLLDADAFYPRTITITFRHTDIWYWESDERMYIASEWVDCCRFPNSVVSIRLQIESTIRRKPQVDDLIRSAKEEWFFQRRDGVHLVSEADAPNEVLEWEGNSTWEGRRWVMDESDDRPGVIKYYCLTAVFQPIPTLNDARGDTERYSRPMVHQIEASYDAFSKTQDGTFEGYRYIWIDPSSDQDLEDVPRAEAVQRAIMAQQHGESDDDESV